MNENKTGTDAGGLSRRTAGPRRAAPLMAGALLLAAITAAGAQRPRFGGADSSRGAASDLRASVETDRTQYTPRRAVEITMRLTNLTDRPKEILLENAHEYDVIVRDARTGGAVWQWSRLPSAPPRQRRTVRIEPRQSRTHRALWDQTDNDGRRVRPGVYRIEATLYARDPVTTEVFLSGREGDDGPQPGPRPGPPEMLPRPGLPPGRGDGGATLRADLRLDQTSVRPGQPVTVTYAVTNSQSRPSVLRFSSGKQFDVVVRSGRAGQPVWRLSQDRMYTMALTQMTLEPGERRTFTAQWQPDRSLPEGAYEVEAFLTPMGEQGGAASARATVRIESRPGGGLGGRAGLPHRPGRDGDSPSIRLGDLFDDGRSYLGKRITLRGAYRGWRGGQGGPPVKRSDWVLEGDGRTIYVSGPMPEAGPGDAVTVTGTVRRTGDGRLYLESE